MLPGVYRFYLSFQIIHFLFCWSFLSYVFILFISSYPSTLSLLCCRSYTLWVWFVFAHALLSLCDCSPLLPLPKQFSRSIQGFICLFICVFVSIGRINGEERSRDVRNYHLSPLAFNPITALLKILINPNWRDYSVQFVTVLFLSPPLQDPLGPSPYSWCPEDLAMAPWANPLNCWPTVFKLKSQRLMSTSMR